MSKAMKSKQIEQSKVTKLSLGPVHIEQQPENFKSIFAMIHRITVHRKPFRKVTETPLAKTNELLFIGY